MYVDHDNQKAISIMEVSNEESFLIVEGLLLLASNEDLSENEKKRVKMLAHQINLEHERIKDADE